MLQGLVEHLVEHPDRIPARLRSDEADDGHRRAAVEWVAGVTDRYAHRAALPRGVD